MNDYLPPQIKTRDFTQREFQIIYNAITQLQMIPISGQDISPDELEVIQTKLFEWGVERWLT